MYELSTIVSQRLNFLYSGQDLRCFEAVVQADINNLNDPYSIQVIILHEEMENMVMPILNCRKIKGIIPSYGIKYFPINNNRLRAEDTMNRILQLLRTAGTSEENIYKVNSYISFLSALDDAVHNRRNQPGQITLELIDRYSTISSVEKAIAGLYGSGAISPEQRMWFLQKYAEVKNAGPVLENFLVSLDNTFCLHASRCQNIAGLAPGDIICFMIKRDMPETQIKVLLQLIAYDLTDSARKGHRHSVSIFEGRRKFGKELADFMGQIVGGAKVSLYTDDFFAGHEAEWKNIMSGYFDAWIFSAHRLMSSCNSISEMFGTIPIVRTTYSVDMDRRLENNRFLDRLFGTNRVDHYTDHVPVYEPRFRKEEISTMPSGVCLVSVNGEGGWVQI